MTGFEWIGQIASAIGSVLPWYQIIQPEEAVLAHRVWGRTKVIWPRKPKFIVTFDILETCETIRCTNFTTKVGQTIWSKDEKQLRIETVLSWTVSDPYLFSITMGDHSSVIGDYVRMGVKKWSVKHDANYIARSEALERHIANRLRYRLRQHGVRILGLCITTAVPTRHISLSGVVPDLDNILSEEE